jgi:hypothetical protein
MQDRLPSPRRAKKIGVDLRRYGQIRPGIRRHLEIESIVDAFRLHERQNREILVKVLSAPCWSRFGEKAFAATGRQSAVGAFEAQKRQPDLFHLVYARGAAACFARGVDSWQQQTNKNANDGDDDQKLDEREGTTATALHWISSQEKR